MSYSKSSNWYLSEGARGSERGDRGEEESLSHSDTHTQRDRQRETERGESLIDTHW